jgi:hypothetical protein
MSVARTIALRAVISGVRRMVGEVEEMAVQGGFHEVARLVREARARLTEAHSWLVESEPGSTGT